MINPRDIRVLVVDDTVTYRRIVSDSLSTIPGISVVGSAPNGRIALARIEQLRPDILTLDLEMPVMDGLELLRQLKQSGSDVGAIVLSGITRESTNLTITALELGAFDFVAKPNEGSSEKNAEWLQQQLRLRIEAFSRRKHTKKILHGRDNQKATRNDAAQTTCGVTEHEPGDVEVVALGISTGGPKALSHMLPQLPADLSAAVLIVQHMPPGFTKSLANDLNKRCGLRVSEAVDGQSVLPGHVLIAPGGRQMKVLREEGQSTIRITDDPRENSCRPSVDCLFRSVARAYGPNAVGVIMTGMGYDGALGCQQMKQRGAPIIAQDESKGYLIDSRLGALAQEAGCTSFNDFCHKSRASRTLQIQVIDAITTQETLFFRDASPFEALKHKAIPEAIDARMGTSSSRRLRIWSAASSTGQEPYSIAMTLADLLPDIHSWDINILATDISDTALAQASLGKYAKHEVRRGMTPTMLSRHFREEEDGWRIKDNIRSMIRFERRNLLKPFTGLGPFDIIFCRNVAIYFDIDVKRNLFNRLADLLTPEGYLFVGSSESLNNLDPRFTPQLHCQSVFYQPNKRSSLATA